MPNQKGMSRVIVIDEGQILVAEQMVCHMFDILNGLITFRAQHAINHCGYRLRLRRHHFVTHRVQFTASL
jgi:hypothetical protein